ncbi:MAG: alcohol dehydrogenase catalytic domain-containing protein [Spirochaetes bacterium]|nr:alcohol dehydrogenase catalytic domain-containing protein [Spirochaetota bacterium]
MLAYIYGEDKKLALREISLPRQTDDNAVIRVGASSICGTDLRTFRYGSSKIKPPRVIGHEVVGEIVSVGSHVTGFHVGDRVQVAPAIGCGRCHLCRTGHPNLCDDLETIGFEYDGTFAEYMEVPSVAFDRGNVSKVAGNVPDVQAVLAEPIACIVNSHQYLDIKDGDSIAIFGSGFIGCMHAELAVVSGASQVMVLEVNPTRAEMAKKLNPALIMIDPTRSNLAQEIRSRTDGRGVDVAIVACSVGSAQIDAMNITAKRGRVSLFGGLPKESMGFLDSNLIHYKEISVHGVHASSPAQNRQTLQWITEGRLDVGPYSKNVFSLRDIEKAFHALNDEKIMKAIIVHDA